MHGILMAPLWRCGEGDALNPPFYEREKKHSHHLPIMLQPTRRSVLSYIFRACDK